jgi:hypothetical protein
MDRTEGAFSVLVPEGWQTVGGIVRSDLMTNRVSAQNIEAKIDFSVQQDPAGSVQVRWCPEIKYCDGRWLMGMFPPGSNYSGMLVWPLQPPAQFLAQIMFPWAHPRAQGAQMINQQPIPELLQGHLDRARQNGVPFQYDGAAITCTYQEDGVVYQEWAATVIENMGQLGAGMWSNKATHYMRAPAADFAPWFSLLTMIYRSVEINPNWLMQEQQRQGILTNSYRQAQQAEQYRAQKALETQRYIQQVQREIAEHHSRTQAEIRNDQYLTMTNQEEYLNPITGQQDLGSNQWNYRWVNPNGDVFYSDHEGDDPNSLDGGVLSRSDWQRTPVRPRFPQ